MLKLFDNHLQYAVHNINIQLQKFATLSRMKFPFKFIIGNDNAMNYVDKMSLKIYVIRLDTQKELLRISLAHVVKQSNEYRK